MGAPPCEPHSTAGKRNGGADSRADTIFDFIRLINETKPLVFCMEEVKGFLSSSKKHLGFYERVAMSRDSVNPESRPGSFFREVMDEFEKTGYAITFDENAPKRSVLNAADYGTPQRRERFILVGVREGPPVVLPRPSHGPNSVGGTALCHLRPSVVQSAMPTPQISAISFLGPLPERYSARRVLEESSSGSSTRSHGRGL